MTPKESRAAGIFLFKSEILPAYKVSAAMYKVSFFCLSNSSGFSVAKKVDFCLFALILLAIKSKPSVSLEVYTAFPLNSPISKESSNAISSAIKW